MSLIINNSKTERNEALEHLKSLNIEEIDNKKDAVSTIFPHSNENLTVMFKKFDIEGKRVATVGSSGDQVIYSIAYGADTVTLIDANPMALPHTELKLAAIKNLTFEEFNDYITNKNIFSKEYYEKIKNDLSKDSQEFWEAILENPELQKKFTRDGIYDSYFRIALDLYNTPDVFEKAKANLGKCKVEFIQSDFQDFKENLADREPYNLVLLSNISDYVDDQTFFNTCVELSDCLTDDGKMQIHYDFERSFNKGYKFVDRFAKYMENKALVKENVKKRRTINTDYKTEGFEGINLEYPRDIASVVLYEAPMTLMVSKDFLKGNTDKTYESAFDSIKKHLLEIKDKVFGKDSDTNEM